MDRTDRSAISADQAPVRLSPEAAARLDSLFREHNPFVVRLAVASAPDMSGVKDDLQRALEARKRAEKARVDQPEDSDDDATASRRR